MLAALLLAHSVAMPVETTFPAAGGVVVTLTAAELATVSADGGLAVMSQKEVENIQRAAFHEGMRAGKQEAVEQCRNIL